MLYIAGNDYLIKEQLKRDGDDSKTGIIHLQTIASLNNKSGWEPTYGGLLFPVCPVVGDLFPASSYWNDRGDGIACDQPESMCETSLTWIVVARKHLCSGAGSARQGGILELLIDTTVKGPWVTLPIERT